MQQDAVPRRRARIARVVRATVGSSLFPALAFLGAGRIHWPRGWIYAGLFVAVSVIGTVVVQSRNSGLLEARAKGVRKDTKPFDRMFFRLFIPLILATPVLAGLDAVRFGWAALPMWTALLGVVLFAVSGVFSTWTMVENAHAETTVRIQTDRDHQVVKTGPYRLVRHPMYAAILLGLPATGLVLGSAWAFAPTAIIVLLFFWRTAREDKTLLAELPGYSDYAAQTRYRLLPGVW